MEEAVPEFAERVRERLDGHVHKTIATLRRDGSPRISGTECELFDGELWFGAMWRSVKALDLQRDPRFALHSGSPDPPGWDGDSKLAGRVVEVADQDEVKAHYVASGKETPEGPSHLFRAEIAEATLVGLNEARNLLVIESWRPGEDIRRIERE